MIFPALVVVFLGAATQRVTGLGFALISSPLLVLLLGPFSGVVMANLLAMLVSTTVLSTSWRDVDLRQSALLAPAGLLGVLPGVWVASRLSPGPLQATIGLLALSGLLTTLVVPTGRLTRHPGVATAAGLTSGFMTATAGVGGPALTAYALATGWKQTTFAATAQISFAAQAAVAVGLKGVQHLPGLLASTALVVAVAAGLGLGQLLAGRVPAAQARRAVIVVAAAGALTTVAKGILTW